MRDKTIKNNKKISSNKKRTESQPHEYETMSQIQNRYGKGREKSGSDGSRGNDGFSNH
jgi:hypothetical protein